MRAAALPASIGLAVALVVLTASEARAAVDLPGQYFRLIEAELLLIEQRLQVVPEDWFDRGWFRHTRHLPFAEFSFGGCRSRLERCLMRHAIEPVGEQLGRGNRPVEDQL